MANKALQILLTWKDQGGIPGLERLGKKADETSGKTTGLGRATTTALVAGGAAVVGFATKSVAEFERLGVETMKLQRYIGGTPEEMSRLRFAAQQAGLDVDTLAKSLGIASKNLVKSNDSLGQFGVEAKNADGSMRPMRDVLLEVSDKFKEMPNGPEKTALALKLFGRAGADMIPFLNRGSEGISELMAKTDQYGLVLGGEQLDRIKKNKEAQRELTAALDGLQVKIGGAVLPMLSAVTQVLAQIPGPIMDIGGPIATVGVSVIGLAVAYQKVSSIVGPGVATLRRWNDQIVAGGDGAGASAAKMGAYAAGIGLVLAASAKSQADSAAFSKTMFSGWDWTDLDTARGKLNEAGAAINRMKDQWNSYSNAEKLAHAQEDKNRRDAEAQYGEALKHYKAAEDAINRVGAALGISGVEAQRLAEDLNIDPARVPFDQLVTTLRAYSEGTISAAEAQIELNGATDDTTEAIENQADVVRAAVDPLFAMVNAQDKQAEAQRKSAEANAAAQEAFKTYTEQAAIWGQNSPQAIEAWNKLTEATRNKESADIDAAKSASDLVFQADKLTTAIASGQVPVDAAIGVYRNLAAQGLITSDQLATIETKFRDASTAAGDLAARTPMSLDVYAETAQAETALARVATALAGLVAARSVGGMVGLSIAGRARGGTVPDGWAMFGESGPELGRKSGSLLQIYPHEQSKHMLGGFASAPSSSPVLSVSGPRIINLNVTVQGSVITTRDLADEIQSLLLAKQEFNDAPILPGVAG